MTAWAVSAIAGTAQASLAVQIQLNNPGYSVPSDYCTSQTLSQKTNATVKVICGSNQFVNIEPQPGNPFLGTHGGAYRFLFEPSVLMSPDDPLWHVGVGTITTMRVFHLDGQEDTMEILVSF